VDSLWPVDDVEAGAVIAAFWDEVVARFLESGFEKPQRIKSLTITSEVHDSCRHFAAVREDGSAVYIAPELVSMPDETILGILAHEAGHVEDLSCPGMYWYRKGRLHVSEDVPEKGFRKVLKAWSDRSDDEVERVADEIAYEAFGIRIGYIGPKTCLVQAMGRGKRRPRGLR
jgi:hypothetical protein